jgi:hypothetical protein
MRAVNGPALDGSPFNTAILAPGGNPGGISPHFRSDGAMTLCSVVEAALACSSCFFSSAAMTNAAAPTITLHRIMIFFMMCVFLELKSSNTIDLQAGQLKRPSRQTGAPKMRRS